MATDSPRVLSLQSHVVHGYVGNRAAVFPLQLLGFEVDVINSVQFATHTGYPNIRGQKLTGEELKVLAEGLQLNEVLNHDYLLTGYIGNVSVLREVVGLLDMLPKTCKYLCDPVLGDNGKLYTSPELVDVYREEVLPRVEVLTPNQFEAELLTKRTITTVAEAASACDTLHGLGCKTVVLTTLDVPDATESGKFVGMLLSEGQGKQKWLLQLPFLEGGPFTGTGDLTAATLLAWLNAHPGEAPMALEKAGATLQSVIQETTRVSQRFEVKGKTVPPELRIIQSKSTIEHPIVKNWCRPVTPSAAIAEGLVVDLSGLNPKTDDDAPFAEALSASASASAAEPLLQSDLSLFQKLAAQHFQVAFMNGDSDNGSAMQLTAEGNVIQIPSQDVLRPNTVFLSDKTHSLSRAKSSGATLVGFTRGGAGLEASQPQPQHADFLVSTLAAVQRFLPV